MVSRASTLDLKPFLLAWFICLLVMELFGAACARSGISNEFDFRSFYTAGYMVRTNPHQLYDLALQKQMQDVLVGPRKDVLAFYHPSYETLLYAPFSMLFSYRVAYLVFLTFNVLLLLAAVFAAGPVVSASRPWLTSMPWLIFFLYVPALAAVVMGQDSILLLLLCCLAWKQIDSESDLSSGFLLALALFKFQIVLPIAALIAIRRGWRFTSGFLFGSAAVALLCLGLGGRGGMASYLRLLSGASSAVDNGVIAQQTLSVFPLAMPNAAGLLYACGARLLRSPIAFDVLVGICTAGLFLWSARSVRRLDMKAAFSVAILCGLLVSYHLYIYDLAPTLLAVALLAGRVPRYILLSMFLLPVVLLPFGSNSFFLLALPVLAMLVYTLAIAPESASSAPAPARAAAV